MRCLIRQCRMNCRIKAVCRTAVILQSEGRTEYQEAPVKVPCVLPAVYQ